MSINLAGILKGSKLRSAFLLARPPRPAPTLLLVVISPALTLVPQNTRLIGLEIAIVVVPVLVITVWNQLRHRRQNSADPLMWTVSRMAGTAVGLLWL